jgi:hypothetical protein
MRVPFNSRTEFGNSDRAVEKPSKTLGFTYLFEPALVNVIEKEFPTNFPTKCSNYAISQGGGQVCRELLSDSESQNEL